MDIDNRAVLFNQISRKTPLIRLVKRFYPRIGLRKEDIILATFPKSGTTWMRFIFANLISLKEFNGRVVDYQFLNNELRGGYDSNLYPTIKYSTFPRIIWTHYKYEQKRFGNNKRIYIYRNPGDTMVSYYEFRKSLKDNPLKNQSFQEFIRNEKYGINYWCEHFLSWKDNCDILVSYEELKDNSLEKIKNVLSKLKLNKIGDDLLSVAIERFSFKNIRSMEEKVGLDDSAKEKHKEGYRFARKGIVGDWVNYFNDEDKNFLIKTLEDHHLYQIRDFTLSTIYEKE